MKILLGSENRFFVIHYNFTKHIFFTRKPKQCSANLLTGKQNQLNKLLRWKQKIVALVVYYQVSLCYVVILPIKQTISDANLQKVRDWLQYIFLRNYKSNVKTRASCVGIISFIQRHQFTQITIPLGIRSTYLTANLLHEFLVWLFGKAFFGIVACALL